MDKLEITIEQLKNYLGTGLKINEFYTYRNGKSTEGVSSIDLPAVMYLVMRNSFDKLQPICYRLSDLDKFIPELGFVPIEEMRNSGFWCDAYDEWYECTYPQKNIDQAPFEVAQLLFEWHFWAFGDQYFDQGLVIDKLSASASLRERKEASNDR